MALMVSSSAQSTTSPNPTAALQAAMTNFESVLTSEQRQQFHSQVQSFNQQQPDTSSVIQFVAQIDALNHGKTRKSVSDRLCTFLDATRQFTGIVDTFVSSSPAIAALVWGGIKTTILIASNVTSYFNKVASLIMVIGQICPIYREFSHLYSDSTSLQQALCEYYAVVVRLVTRVVQVSQRTVITSMLSAISPFESEFGPFQNELAEASRMVKLQVSLAAKQAAQVTAKLVELESGKNRQYRRFARRLASEIRTEHDTAQKVRIQESIRRAAKTRLYIKDQLSTINHLTPWKQALKQRLTDTAEWFRGEQSFQAWEADTHSATLWCPGRMGVGKTILVSNIIAYLHLSLQPGDVISYHFCRSEDSTSLLARSILGTLARQILDKDIDNARGDQLQSLRDACEDIDTKAVVGLLLSRLEKTRKYYIIVDGLDECTRDQVYELMENMAKLHRPGDQTIKVLYSGRPELEHLLFGETMPNYRLPLSKAAVNADVERYIDTELDECLEKQKIKLVNPEAILKIRDALFADHDGILLFVRLFIEEICTLGNEHAVLEALDDPPKTISDLLATRVRRTQDHSLAIDAMKLLRYCGCLKRPLMVNEFSELLSISVSQISLDRTKIPQNMDQIIAACYGLIYVEEEEATVHYLHHSVKQHLITNSDTRQEGFIESDIDTDLGCLCLTYLNFNDFKRQLTKVSQVSNMSVKPIDMGLVSTQNSSSMISGLARRLLQARRSSQHMTAAEFSRKAEDIIGEGESARLRAESKLRQFYLLDYVQSHWVWHLSSLEESSKMWHRFTACVRGENDLALRPWIQDGDQHQRREAMSPSSTEWALAHRHNALLLHDLLHKPHMLPKGEKSRILRKAIRAEDQHLVRAIIHPRDPKHREPEVIQQGLVFAAIWGREHLVELFILSGVDVNAIADEFYDRTALQSAAEGGHLDVVERLLAASADVNAAAAAATQYGRTALQAAAEEGHLAVVERLLVANADVNATAVDYYGRTALQAAAEGGHLDVVERLLAANADVNAAADYYGWTALQAAAGGGHLAVVERLKLAGAHKGAPF